MSETKAAPLVLAVPSKGRLQENAAHFFARAGLDVVQGRGVRDYRGTLAGMKGVEIAFLSAAEIVQQLAAGAVHMGVTGEDLVRETIADADRRVELLTPLGFGYCQCRGRGAAGLDRREDHGRSRGRRGLLSRAARQPDAGRDQIRQSHAPLLRRPRRDRLPDRRKPRGDRGRARRGPGRAHRRHHHHGRDAQGQCPESPR